MKIEYFKVEITFHERNAGRNQEWYHSHLEEKTFQTIQEARKFIADRYKKSSKENIFIDRNGKAEIVGKLYKSKYNFWKNNNKKSTMYTRDWVTITKVIETIIL